MKAYKVLGTINSILLLLLGELSALFLILVKFFPDIFLSSAPESTENVGIAIVLALFIIIAIATAIVCIPYGILFTFKFRRSLNGKFPNGFNTTMLILIPLILAAVFLVTKESIGIGIIYGALIAFHYCFFIYQRILINRAKRSPDGLRPAE